MRNWRSTVGGVVLAGGVFAATVLVGLPNAQRWTAAITTLCAVWWITEALPLAATSLVPLALFPLSGVLSERDVGAAYGDPIVLLFMGGFMLSKAAERSETHRRLAHAMLRGIGSTSGRKIVLAFMLTTAVSSMWISNTATALVMLPVALAVLERDKSHKLGVPLLLGIAYSASIGGIITPIGSPPNGVFLAVYRQATDQSVPFHQWMMLAGSIALPMLGVAWLVLTWRLGGVAGIQLEQNIAWTAAQRRTLAVFALAALAWITRTVPCGGWSGLLDSWRQGPPVGDATVAIAAAVAMFLIPSGERDGKRLLDWPTAVQIPWGILILFGGGITIAKAFESSGLSSTIGGLVATIQHFPILLLVGTICLGTALLTEFTSNTATANVLLPILAAAADAADLEPMLLMVPATIIVSFAFMLPVATPPNAIICGSGHVRIADMFRIGLVLDLIGVVIVTVGCWLLLPAIFGASSGGN